MYALDLHTWIDQTLISVGLDLVAPRSLASIRTEMKQLGLELPPVPNPLGLVIGNTRALWPKFLATLREQTYRLEQEHPLDQWIEELLWSALERFPARPPEPLPDERSRVPALPSQTAHSGSGVAVYFAHRRAPCGFLPLQRWAQSLGVFALSPSHLSVHRNFGPWIALRALVIVNVDTSELDLNAIDGLMVTTAAIDPCGSCSAPCVEPFQRAARESLPKCGLERVVSHWRHWLAVRDACPVGREFRYSDGQIAYHYGRDRSGLM